MKTYIETYDPKTGKRGQIDFQSADAAFKKYWELTDDPPDFDFELVTEG